jgi:transcription elongation factor Elf1
VPIGGRRQEPRSHPSKQRHMDDSVECLRCRTSSGEAKLFSGDRGFGLQHTKKLFGSVEMIEPIEPRVFVCPACGFVQFFVPDPSAFAPS